MVRRVYQDVQEPLMTTPSAGFHSRERWVARLADVKWAWKVVTSPQQVQKLLQCEYPSDVIPNDADDGLPFYLLVLLVLCYALNMALRLCRVYSIEPVHLFVRNNSSRSPANQVDNFIDDVYGIQEFFVGIFVIWGVLTGLYSLKRPGFKALIRFPLDMPMIGFSSVRRASARQISGAAKHKHKPGCWRSFLNAGSVVLRYLCASPIFWIIAIALYIYEERQAPPVLSKLIANFWTWTQSRFSSDVGSSSNSTFTFTQAFLLIAHLMVQSQLVFAVLIGAKIYERACKNGIRSIVDEIDALGDDKMVNAEDLEDHRKDCLGLALTHVSDFRQNMIDFWSFWEGGIPSSCVLATAFSFIVAAGLSAAIKLNSTHGSVRRALLPDVATFFFGLLILVRMLSFLAKITSECTSTDLHSRSIVSSSRRYINWRLKRDMASDPGRLPMTLLQRQALLTAGAMIESQCVGVQLLGSITVSYMLALNTALRLGVYTPVIYSAIHNLLNRLTHL